MCCYTSAYEWSGLNVICEKTGMLGEKLQLRSLLLFKATMCLIVHTAAHSCEWANCSTSNSLPTGAERPAATHSSCWDHHSLLWPGTSIPISKSQMGSLSCSAAYSLGIAEWPAFAGAGHIYLFKKNKDQTFYWPLQWHVSNSDLGSRFASFLNRKYLSCSWGAGCCITYAENLLGPHRKNG